jgi:hypothetical protein
VEKCIGGGRPKPGNVECHMDPNISKVTTDRERVVSVCAESQSKTGSIRTTRCDKKSLLTGEDVFKKHNLMVVGGHTDNAVDLCAEDNADSKRQYLGKGRTMLTKQPSQSEFEKCWSPIYTQTHRDTGIESTYVTDRFAIQFKAVRRLICDGMKCFHGPWWRIFRRVLGTRISAR